MTLNLGPKNLGLSLDPWNTSKNVTRDPQVVDPKIKIRCLFLTPTTFICQITFQSHMSDLTTLGLLGPSPSSVPRAYRPS